MANREAREIIRRIADLNGALEAPNADGTRAVAWSRWFIPLRKARLDELGEFEGVLENVTRGLAQGSRPVDKNQLAATLWALAAVPAGLGQEGALEIRRQVIHLGEAWKITPLIADVIADIPVAAPTPEQEGAFDDTMLRWRALMDAEPVTTRELCALFQRRTGLPDNITRASVEALLATHDPLGAGATVVREVGRELEPPNRRWEIVADDLTQLDTFLRNPPPDLMAEFLSSGARTADTVDVAEMSQRLAAGVEAARRAFPPAGLGGGAPDPGIGPGTTQARSTPGRLDQAAWNIHVTPELFVDREEQLARARDHLSRPGRPVYVVTGGGGTGKSEIARHIAVDMHDRHLAASGWPINAETPISLIDSLCEAAAVANTPKHDDRAATARAFRDAVAAAPQRWLLLFDNAPSGDAIAEWVPRTGAMVLVTTRDRLGWSSWLETVHEPLDPLPPDAAAELLDSRVEWLDLRAARQIVDSIKDRVSLDPFVIRGVGAYLITSGLTAEAYLTQFPDRPITMVSAGDAGAAVSGWAESIANLDEPTRHLLGVCAWLDPDRMPIEPLVGRTKVIDIDREDANRRLLDVLVAAGFIQPSEGRSFRIHRLLQLLVRQEVDADRTCLQEAVRRCLAPWPGGVLDPRHGPQLDRLGPLLVRVLHALYDEVDAGTIELSEDMADVAAGACLNGAAWLRNWGSEWEGLRLARRGQTHQVGASDISIGRLLYELSLYGNKLAPTRDEADEETLRLREEAADRLRGAGPAGLRYLPPVLARLGNIVASADKTRGLALMEEALALLRANPGASKVEFGNVLGILSERLINDGNFTDGAAYAREAVEMFAAADVGPHRTRIRLIADLARATRRLGDIVGALELYRQALDLFEEAMGGRRSSTTYGSRLSDFGYLLRDAGRVRESVPYLEQALAVSQDLKASQPTIAVRKSTLGLTYTYLGDYERGEALLKEALTLSANSEPRKWVIRANNWGLYLNHRLTVGTFTSPERQQRAEEACAVFRTILTALPMSKVRAEWLPLANRGLVEALIHAHQWDEARARHAASMAELEGFYGPDHPETGACVLLGARLAAHDGEKELVHAWANRAYRIFRTSYGPKTRDLILPWYSETMRLLGMPDTFS